MGAPSFPTRFLVGVGPGSVRGRVQVDGFVVQSPPDGTDQGDNFDRFTLSQDVVLDPDATEIQVYVQGLKEPHANVAFDQPSGPTIVNMVWTRQPVGGEYVEIIYRTED